VTPAIFLALVVVVWVYGLIKEPEPTGAALATVVAGALVFFIGRSYGWISDGTEKVEEK
jgi:Na+-driven multidrug efflux pump